MPGILLLLLVVCASPVFSQGGPTVAFVTGGGDLNDGYDMAFHDFMVGLGYDVTVILAGDVGGAFNVAAAETYDLLVYSESPSSSSVDPLTNGGTSLPNVPIIHCEGYGWDNLGLFSGTAGWIADTEAAATVTPTGAAHPIMQAAGISAGAFTILTTNSNPGGEIGTTQDGPVSDVQVLMTAGTTIPNAPVVWILEGGVRAGYDSPVVGLTAPHGAPTAGTAGMDVNLPFTDYTAEYITLLTEIFNYLAPVGPPEIPLEIAGELLVDVSANDPSAGTATWINNGTLGDFNFVTTATLPAGSSANLICGTLGVDLVLTEYEGVPVVHVMSAPSNLAGYVGPTSVPGIEGNGDRSIEAWVVDPDSLPGSQPIVGWSERGGPNGSNMFFSYGTHDEFGAAIHWSGDFDTAWGVNGSLVPTTGTLHHLVYTYQNTTIKLYNDGAMIYERTLPSPLVTKAGLSINLFVQNDTPTGGLSNNALPASLMVNSVRVHDGVLSDAQVLANFQRGPDGGGGGSGPVNSARDWSLYR